MSLIIRKMQVKTTMHYQLTFIRIVIIKKTRALAGVTQWIECQPVNQKVTGSIPSHGTCLDSGPGPQWGHVRGNHTVMFLSLSPSLPLCLKIK